MPLDVFPSPLAMPLLATLAALGGAVFGLWLTGAHDRTALVVSFSGGLLIGVAVFGLLPELAGAIGWLLGLALFIAGYFLLLGIDRYVYPVCPSCSDDHDHISCTAKLHGFAAPLIIAATLHAFLDGWSIATSQWTGTPALRIALPLAVALHKIPEGIALGAILRVSVRTRLAAFGWCLAAESMTLAGAALGAAIASHVETRWLHFPLAIAGGCFFYLGYHAVHAEWRRRGSWMAFVPALTGAAGAAALQHGVQAFYR